MNVLEAFLHDPLVEWSAKKKTSVSVSTKSARRAALAVVPLSQKRHHRTGYGGGLGGGGGGGADEERDGVNENAKRIIHRIGQRLRGLYQRKLDLLLHDEEFRRQRLVEHNAHATTSCMTLCERLSETGRTVVEAGVLLCWILVPLRL